MTSDQQATSADIEFWFDFASGYAYFAALEIEALAARHYRSVLWRPFCLGSAFKITGSSGLSRTPLKGDYAKRDWQRLARLKGVAFSPPANHPLTGLPALRAFYVMEKIDRNAAVALAKAVILDYFEQGLNIDDPQSVATTGAKIGLDPDVLIRGIRDPTLKQQVREIGDAAVARGVFGSPWIVVDGEPFWGSDRLAMVDQWLTRGRW